MPIRALARLALLATLATPLQARTPTAASTRCADIPFAAADAGAVAVPSAPDAWGGPRGGDTPTLSNRVANYRIHATLDPLRHTIEGRQQLTWKNRGAQPVCSVYLHLYLNAFESGGSTFMTERRTRGFGFRSDAKIKDGDWGYTRLKRVAQGGRAVKWAFVQPDGGPKTDKTVVRLDLPAPVAPGAITTLDIDFFNQLPRVVARTGHFGSFHLVAQWFPKIGVLELAGERGATAPRWNVHEFHLHSEFYADFGRYDVSITVPSDYTVGATGELTGTPVKKDGQTTYRYVQGDVHDFAWTADNRTAKPLEATWTRPGGEPVKVRVLFPPEYADNAPVVLKAALDSLTYFSDTLGCYPYRTVTAVIPPHNAAEAGGMEYPTFFTADNTLDYTPGGIEQYSLEFVTVHEFGHGYFQGILASNEFEEPMLDEGVNQYWNSRMLADRRQPVNLLPGWLARWTPPPRIAPFDLDRLLAQLASPLDPLGANSWERRSSASYGTVYSRTSTMMAGIERQVGREAMARAMKHYYQRWKFRHPSIADLREALIEGTGQREVIERTFAQTVYGAEKVDDRIDAFSSTEELPVPGHAGEHGKPVSAKTRGRAIANARQAWAKAHPDARPGVGGPYPYRTTVVVKRAGADVPQTLVVSFADGSRETVRFAGQRHWFRWSWVKPAKAVKAELDPDRLHPLDRSRTDNARALEPNHEAGRHYGRRMLAWMQLALAWMMGA
ncbi:M1 family peptidase [Lysobacter pythonis]|uniref:M1 family peptidase n=1 Tax=Solilutibacter pythonis TaxID=2483112 RepID=A0A3M2HV13_9GAMM|nr:M1 family metallopeptidase [Lysobacter pythonis]RMH93576.1 M1 family peptidase [Lysobacter pythonis]